MTIVTVQKITCSFFFFFFIKSSCNVGENDLGVRFVERKSIVIYVEIRTIETNRMIRLRKKERAARARRRRRLCASVEEKSRIPS